MGEASTTGCYNFEFESSLCLERQVLSVDVSNSNLTCALRYWSALAWPMPWMMPEKASRMPLRSMLLYSAKSTSAGWVGGRRRESEGART